MTAEEWVAERIRQLVDAAPPLPEESLEVIRRLMRPSPAERNSVGNPGCAA